MGHSDVRFLVVVFFICICGRLVALVWALAESRCFRCFGCGGAGCHGRAIRHEVNLPSEQVRTQSHTSLTFRQDLKLSLLYKKYCWGPCAAPATTNTSHHEYTQPTATITTPTRYQAVEGKDTEWKGPEPNLVAVVGPQGDGAPGNVFRGTRGDLGAPSDGFAVPGGF